MLQKGGWRGKKDELRPVQQLIQSFLSLTAKNRARYSWHLIWHSIWWTVSSFDLSMKKQSSDLGESLPSRLNNLLQVLSVKPVIGKKFSASLSTVLDLIISIIFNTLKLSHVTRLSHWRLTKWKRDWNLPK